MGSCRNGQPLMPQVVKLAWSHSLALVYGAVEGAACSIIDARRQVVISRGSVTTGQGGYQSHHYHRVPGYHFGGSAGTTPATTLQLRVPSPGRATGVTLPLVIDAPQWGQDIDMLQAVGPALVEADPSHNLLFSVHMWWTDASGSRVRTELQQSVDMDLPLIVGEFAQHAVYLCDQSPFAYTVLLEEAQRHEIGWLAWSWGSVGNSDCANQGSFDMTVDGTFGNWEASWGEAVALSDPNSIKNTAHRPGSIAQGSCR